MSRTMKKTALQEFLSVYRMTSSANITAKMSTLEHIFGWKGRSIFVKFLTGNEKYSQQFKNTRSFKIGDNFFFKSLSLERKIDRKEKKYRLFGSRMYIVESG